MEHQRQVAVRSWDEEKTKWPFEIIMMGPGLEEQRWADVWGRPNDQVCHAWLNLALCEIACIDGLPKLFLFSLLWGTMVVLATCRRRGVLALLHSSWSFGSEVRSDKPLDVSPLLVDVDSISSCVEKDKKSIVHIRSTQSTSSSFHLSVHLASWERQQWPKRRRILTSTSYPFYRHN